jgi:Arc/MetJ-type ribon-helix-helix transcriptional regulator
MKMVSFELNDTLYQQLQQVKESTGKSRSELLREGLKLVTSFYEQNFNAVTDKLTVKNVLSELMKQL